MATKEEKILSYFKELASFEDEQSHKVSLANGQKSKSWTKIYDKVEIKSECVIKKFLNPVLNIEKHNSNGVKIFPFGANSSQITAIDHALENQISIIEGPPGTGKTQTILNIITNLLLRDKSILIISNNNKAIENIKEKMEEYGLDFLMAFLGSSTNQKHFLEKQIKEYPKEILDWNFELKDSEYFSKTFTMLKEIFIKKELVAKYIHELNEIKLEFSYFDDIYNETRTFDDNISKLSSCKIISLINIYEKIIRENKDKKISLFTRIKIYFKYRIKISKIKNSNVLKFLFYKNKISELEKKIKTNEDWLLRHDENKISAEFYSESFKVLKKNIFSKYHKNIERKQFENDDLWKRNRAEGFVKEYPIILSTNHSAFDTLDSKFIFDYVIMDEASQTRLFNTLPILSRTKNLVIVGDDKQLQQINEYEKEGEKIYQKYQDIIPNFYNDSSNNFLSLLIKSNPNIKSVMLKEHYRCHPQIINFCNKKFYNNELIIMTKDKGEKNVLELQQTPTGNHATWTKSGGTSNLRETQTIKLILEDSYFKNLSKDKIGIITPYNEQCRKIKKELNDEIKDIYTVHKIQGNEKDTIIFSTTDNQISDFVNNPELINVAVSRAKNKFVLVTNGNKKQTKISDKKQTNIIDDFAEYIRYINKDNINIEIRVESIFDLLYSQYKNEREKFLKNATKISRYDSENIFYLFLSKVIKDYPGLDITFEYSLNLLIKDKTLLKDFPELIKFASNNWSHIDFIIYNKITKRPILGIEVDGYSTHDNNPKQKARDAKKDEILKIYNFPLLRLSTKGSQEDEKIRAKINELYL